MSDPLERLISLRSKAARQIIGLMSGTSADGVDAALVEVRSVGADAKITLLAFAQAAIPPALKKRIWSAPDANAKQLCELNFLLGEAFAIAARNVVDEANVPMESIDLIGSHGQTARHQPPGTGVASTLQIAEGAVIAERTGIPVICDFRVADMAAGGQGAPLIPYVDHVLLSDPQQTRAALNLGGIANVTVITPDINDVLAFDTGPANMALDAVARAASYGQQAYDRDGKLAAAGQVDTELLTSLLGHPYFRQPPPKSTGREQFGRDFVYPLIDQYGERLEDLMATLVQLSAQSVGLAFTQFINGTHDVSEVLISGGGVHNPPLLRAIERALAPLPVNSLAATGIDPDAKEAMGFALLANETLHGQPSNCYRTTGARGPRVLGKIALPGPMPRKRPTKSIL